MKREPFSGPAPTTTFGQASEIDREPARHDRGVATRTASLAAHAALWLPLVVLALVIYLGFGTPSPDAPVEVQLSRVVVGFGLALLVAAATAWSLAIRQEADSVPPTGVRPDAARLREERARQHARWFVDMRWIAVVVSLVIILIAVVIARVLPPTATAPLLGWWLLLVAANAVFAFRVRHVENLEREIMLQGLLDLVVLTGWLSASGGIENPFYQAYVLHVIIAGTLLGRRRALTVTFAACSLISLLALAEYFRVVTHVTLEVFPHVHEADAAAAADSTVHAALDPVFVAGRVLPFLATLALVAYLTTMIADRLRQSEAALGEAVREEALERRRLEGFIESAGIGAVLIDPDFVVRWYGGQASHWLGLDPSSIGATCDADGPESDCACLVGATIASGAPQETERALIGESGERRYFRHATWPIVDGEGRVQQVLKLVEDVTARKALELEAVHAGKLSVLGKMAAAVAHEINNPLASLSSRIALMGRTEDPGFWHDSLAVLQGQVGRISRIVHTVSQFGRAPTAGRSSWDVHGAVEEALGVVRLDPRASKVEIDWRPSPAPLYVNAVRDQIVQAYLNLMINAAEAMPKGGTLSIRAFAYQGDVGVALRDAGVGIAESLQNRLFEPFASTKPTGTGIGLAISHSFVQGHGGRIDVQSRPGEGACFTVYLPQVPEPSPGETGEVGS